MLRWRLYHNESKGLAGTVGASPGLAVPCPEYEHGEHGDLTFPCPEYEHGEHGDLTFPCPEYEHGEHGDLTCPWPEYAHGEHGDLTCPWPEYDHREHHWLVVDGSMRREEVGLRRQGLMHDRPDLILTQHTITHGSN